MIVSPMWCASCRSRPWATRRCRVVRRRLLVAQAAREGRVAAEGQQAHPLINQGPQVLVQLVGGVMVVESHGGVPFPGASDFSGE